MKKVLKSEKGESKSEKGESKCEKNVMLNHVQFYKGPR